MKTLFTKISTITVIIVLIFTTSCEKDSTTATPPNTTVDTLCDGIPGNTSFLPLAVGNKWTYGRTYNVPGDDTYTEEIIGDTIISGLDYFIVRVTDAAFGINIDYEKLYRVDSSGDVYEMRFGSTEHLIAPANPVVGDIVWDDYKVVDINASISAGGCSYTGCLKIMDTSILQIYFYYKPGVGMVESSDYTIADVDL